jgi:hypothetical protein
MALYLKCNTRAAKFDRPVFFQMSLQKMVDKYYEKDTFNINFFIFIIINHRG